MSTLTIIPDPVLDAELIEPEDAPLPPSVETPQPVRRKSSAGRKSNAERERIKADNERKRIEAKEALERARRRAEVEANRAVRIQPDTKPVLAVALGMSVLILATSFAISYATMAATAEWMKLPFPWLAFALPGAIELFMLFASVDYLITRSRGGTGRQALVIQWVLTVIAVTANSLHTVSEWGSAWGVEQWQSIIGTVLSAAAPLVLVVISKRLSALVFVSPDAAK